MISKELLYKVLDFENIEGREWDFCIRNNRVVVTYNKNDFFDGNKKEINIHGLAHKCKEWAYENDVVLISGHSIVCIDDGKYFCNILPISTKHKCTAFGIQAYSETEAIFKACQWILENE